MSDYWIKSSRQHSSSRNYGQFEARVVGVTYDNRQQVIKQLVTGEKVWLRREPHNPHDPNAIKVERSNGQQIGYIARGLAQTLAPAFDSCGGSVPATVKAIIGGHYSGSAMGVVVTFQAPESPDASQSIGKIDGFSADDF